NASSPGGARQRLIGLGSRRPGASSMKNCPGSPGSRPPRFSRSRVYGPTASLATTSSRFLLRTDSLLERYGEVALRVRDRVHGCSGAGHGRDAGDPRSDRGLADQVAVRARARVAEGRVHDEVAVTTAH